MIVRRGAVDVKVGIKSRRLNALALTVALLVAACGPAASTVTPSPATVAAPSVDPTDSSSIPGSVSPTSPGTPTVNPSDDGPAGDAWIEAGTLHDDRTVMHLAVLDETDEVMAVGADVACGLESKASDTAELYDVHARAWHVGPPMPSGRHSPTVAALDGRVLVTGGSNQEYVAKSGTVLYDANARSWSASGLLATARIDPASAILSEGRVLVAGGLHIGFDHSGRVLDTAEIWDPATSTWVHTTKLSVPRYAAKAVTLDDGRVLVVGGLPTQGADNQHGSAELYDPVSGHWTAAGDLSTTPRWISLVASFGGALAVYATDDGRALRSAWFDPGTLTWSPADDPDVPAGEGRAAMATLQDSRVLLIHGAEARIFPPGGTWTTARSIPDGPRNDASAALLADGSVLVAGGWSVGPEPGETGGCETPNRQAWRYIPAPVGSE
jgi:hypothetical protein